MVITNTDVPDLTAVVEAFAAYVTAVTQQSTSVDKHHAYAHKQAHAYLQLLIERGDVSPDGYNYRFLRFVADVFSELATRHPENRIWLNLCLVRREIMTAASMLASPDTKHQPPRVRDNVEEAMDAAPTPQPQPERPLLSVTLAEQRRAATQPRRATLSTAQLEQRRAAGKARTRHPRRQLRTPVS